MLRERWAGKATAALLFAAVALLGLWVGRRIGSAAPRTAEAALPEAVAVVPDTAQVPTLLYVFQPEDCAAYSALGDYWGRLHAAGTVRAVGVPLRLPRDPDRRHRLLDRLAFPVRPELADRARRLVLGLGYRSTPLSVLLDDAGRARVVVPPPEPGRRGAGMMQLVERAARYTVPLETDPTGP